MKNIVAVWKRMSKGAKASIALLFAKIISVGIAYITTPLYTRLLTSEEYGQVSVFLTWVQVFGIIAMFCLSEGVFNNGMLDYKKERDEYSYSMLILSNLITLVFSMVLFAVYPLVKDILGLDIPLLILMCAIFLFQPAYLFFIQRKMYELKYKSTVLWTIVIAVTSPLVALICILTFENDLYARIFGEWLTLIAIYMGFYIYIAAKGRGKFTTKYWKSVLLFNLPLIPHYLSTYLLGSSDKVMIAGLIGDSAAAYYSVAYSVGTVAIIVWKAVNSSLTPFTYKKCEQKDYKAISRITLPLLTGFAAICISVVMLAPELVAIMATDDYMQAIYVIPPVAGGLFFQVQYFIYANIIYYYKKPKYVMFASVGATILNIVLNYLFIPRYGFIAAGYTTIFCYFIQAAADYFALCHVVHEKIYNMKYIGALTLGVVIVALLSNFIYGMPILRFAILLVIILCVILFRHKLIEMFQTVGEGKREEP